MATAGCTAGRHRGDPHRAGRLAAAAPGTQRSSVCADSQRRGRHRSVARCGAPSRPADGSRQADRRQPEIPRCRRCRGCVGNGAHALTRLRPGPNPVRMRSIACAIALCGVVALSRAAAAQCAGDCDGNGEVTINEIITLIDCAFGFEELVCPCANTESVLDITYIIKAVNNALTSCPQPEATPTPLPPTPTPTPTGGAEEFVAQASDFECLTNWTKVRQFRIVNKAGHGPEALAVASASYDVSGLEFPVGTIVQL